MNVARLHSFDHLDDEAEEDVLLPEFSEEAIALAFAERHSDDLRYVATWNRWLQWNSTKWVFDETYQAFDHARELCREFADQAGRRQDARAAKQIARAQTVAAVLNLARADRRIATVSQIWDANAMWLNTPGGIVDLSSGKLIPHAPTYFITKSTATAPGEDCPIWNGFIKRITAGDDELAHFLQRMAGYGLTGSTAEHALFFLFGHGGNGKSVFVNTLSAIMGDYATTAAIETFTASAGEQHPTGLAMLRGARLVTAVETEEGRRWAEARIKTLTGGDPISARFMRQDFFKFVPTFKLVIAGNHKPGLRSVDEAIRRRFHLVPFTVTISAAERDPDLTHKLKAEYGGILRWMVNGALLWQERGLCPPAAVRAATAEYLTGEDALTAWADERCERAGAAWETTSALYGSWKAWADASGEYAGSTKRFSQAMEAHGFSSERRKIGRGFLGLKLRTEGWHDRG